MSCMFDECSSLKEINFNRFITDNVTNMNYMFNKCSSLNELNLNAFNTMNVKEMSAIMVENYFSNNKNAKIYKRISPKS